MVRLYPEVQFIKVTRDWISMKSYHALLQSDKISVEKLGIQARQTINVRRKVREF